LSPLCDIMPPLLAVRQIIHALSIKGDLPVQRYCDAQNPTCPSPNPGGSKEAPIKPVLYQGTALSPATIIEKSSSFTGCGKTILLYQGSAPAVP
jgi:hypothetical protein